MSLTLLYKVLCIYLDLSLTGEPPLVALSPPRVETVENLLSVLILHIGSKGGQIILDFDDLFEVVLLIRGELGRTVHLGGGALEVSHWTGWSAVHNWNGTSTKFLSNESSLESRYIYKTK